MVEKKLTSNPILLSEAVIPAGIAGIRSQGCWRLSWFSGPSGSGNPC